MNKHILFVLLLGFVSTGAEAQSLPPGRTEETYVMTDKGIVGMMEMDTTQRRQLESIERRYESDLDALLKNDTISDEAAKAQADRIAGARHREMKTVLTPAQYQRWAQMIADSEVQ